MVNPDEYVPSRNVIRHIRDNGKALIDGVLYEGIPGKSDGKLLVPGDLYIGERNSGPKVLTCKRVDERSWVVPIEDAYPFDTWECVGVRRVQV